MPMSYPVLRGPQIDTSNWLNAYRQGNEDRRQNEQRNLLKEIGGQMASGNMAGAAGAAFKGGQVDTGLGIQKYAHGLDLQNQETQFKLLDFLGGRATAADTPEKQDAVFKIMERVFGADKVAPLRGVPWDQVAAGFIDEKTKLERQKTEAETRKINAQAQFYAGGGARVGQTERIVERLMSDDPELGYGDAVTIAKRGNSSDDMQRERLAAQGLRYGNFNSLEEARSYYGISPSQARGSGGPFSSENSSISTPYYGPKAAPPQRLAPPPNLSPPSGPGRTGSFSPGMPLPALSIGRGSSPIPPMPQRKKPVMGQGNGADQLSLARRAIQRGADPAAVKQRLQELGVDPSGL